MRTVYILVCGILTVPGASDNWNGKGVTYIMTRNLGFAEKLDYFVGIIGRAFGQKKRVAKLIKMMKFWMDAETRIVLVGHSNGCAVILDALKEIQYPYIHELHLFAPACDADCSNNGLNQLHVTGSVTVYIANQDTALMFADTFTGRFLGYGGLGRSGPKNCTRPVRTVRYEGGHSTFFEPLNFNKTMEHITSSVD